TILNRSACRRWRAGLGRRRGGIPISGRRSSSRSIRVTQDTPGSVPIRWQLVRLCGAGVLFVRHDAAPVAESVFVAEPRGGRLLGDGAVVRAGKVVGRGAGSAALVTRETASNVPNR